MEAAACPSTLGSKIPPRRRRRRRRWGRRRGRDRRLVEGFQQVHELGRQPVLVSFRAPGADQNRAKQVLKFLLFNAVLRQNLGFLVYLPHVGGSLVSVHRCCGFGSSPGRLPSASFVLCPYRAPHLLQRIGRGHWQNRDSSLKSSVPSIPGSRCNDDEMIMGDGGGGRNGRGFVERLQERNCCPANRVGSSGTKLWFPGTQP